MIILLYGMNKSQFPELTDTQSEQPNELVPGGKDKDFSCRTLAGPLWAFHLLSGSFLLAILVIMHPTWLLSVQTCVAIYGCSL
jgi:hypothetical protein